MLWCRARRYQEQLTEIKGLLGGGMQDRALSAEIEALHNAEWAELRAQVHTVSFAWLLL